MFKFRKSNRPSKQLLWIIVCKYLLKQKYISCIDIASANFILYKYISSDIYYALDIDINSINFIKKNYPEVTTYHSSIEDFKTSLKWNLVLCLQTIGINYHYNNNNTPMNINKLINITEQDGTLIFNLGPESIKFKNTIEKKLKDKFLNLKMIEYGTLSSNNYTIISIILGLTMYYFPFLRNLTKTYCLFICKNKK